MDDETAYRSFRAAERFFESEYKSGRITREQTRKFIDEARKNYRNKRLNREIESGNTSIG